MRPSVVILTFNSAASIRKTLGSIESLSDDIHVVDSGSTDGTVAIAMEFKAQVHHHAFSNYGSQRNWAIDTLPLRYAWQLHLDADESVSPELLAEIKALPEDGTESGFFVKRFLKFMNRILLHNLAPTWHMRLFKTGAGRCEDREYDQHFYASGATRRLNGSMIDDLQMSLSEWTSRHNRWTDAEVRELLNQDKAGRIAGSMSGNVVERKRYIKGYYDRAPLFLRAWLLFVYRYFLRGGFLDGKEGLIFCVLQTLWFRFLIDAKLYEHASSAPDA
jgi:glycosyltransferase involved in cell wall biosynthesis